MADHLGSYLDEFVPECPKGPVFHWLGQYEPPEKITQVVSQSK